MKEETFDWEIPFMKENEELRSPSFSFGKAMCYLKIEEINCMSCICLYEEYISGRAKRPYPFKTSLIYPTGQEFLTQHGSAFREQDIILCFSRSYIIQLSEVLFPEGSLKIRLSWNYEKEMVKKDTKTALDRSPGKKLSTLTNTLSKDFSRFYESKTCTDYVLKAGESEFPVHSQVLSARSEVFREMFRKDASKNRSGVLDIPGIDAAVLNNVLYYVYSGRILELTSDSAVPMYVVAKKYDLIELKERCLYFLMHNLTIANFVDAAVLAHTHSEVDLLAKIGHFVGDTLEGVKESDVFKTLSTSNPSLAIDILWRTLSAFKEKCTK